MGADDPVRGKEGVRRGSVGKAGLRCQTRTGSTGGRVSQDDSQRETAPLVHGLQRQRGRFGELTHTEHRTTECRDA